MEVENAESAAGFRSFWEKTKREEAHRNLTFVQVEDGGGSERRRRRRGVGKTTADAEQPLLQPNSSVDEDRRQQTPSKSEKEYSKCLRSERAELQQLLEKIKAETQLLSAENDSMKAALSSNGFGANEEVSIAFSTSQGAVEDTGNSVASKAGEPRRIPEEKNDQIFPFEAEDPRVNQCHTLLLKDIEAYRADEEQEKVAWDDAVNAILTRM